MDTKLTDPALKSLAGNNLLPQNHPDIERPMSQTLAFNTHMLTPR